MPSNTTPLSQQIAYLAKGTVDEDGTDQLAELIKMVRLTGRKGTLTLTLEVSMLDKSSEDAMRIVGDVKTKAPKMEKPTTIMFSTGDGDLLRDDPEQMKMDLRQVGHTQPETARRISSEPKTPKQVNNGE